MAAAATPLDNPTDWIGSLGKGAQKKVAYAGLDWANKLVGKEEPVPGHQKQETSQKDFMSHLKDGAVLAQLANKLQPGSVETVHEKPTEPEKQLSNVNGFLNFAKEKVGMGEKELFKADDLMAGKGFPQVLGTLVGLGTKSQDKFGVGGLSTDTLLQLATSAVGKNFLQSLLEKIPNPFKKSAAPAAPAEEVKESQAAESAKPTENGESKPSEEKSAEAKAEAPAAPPEAQA